MSIQEANCYYIVKARTSYPNIETNEIEFRQVEKRFESANPINAREEAFRFRNAYLYGMLHALGVSDKEIGWNSELCQIEKLSDIEVRDRINPFLENDSIDENEEWETPDDTLAWYEKFNNGIWIIFKHSDKELHKDDDGEIVIDKVCKFKGALPIPPNYINLVEEAVFYEKYAFDTKHYKAEVFFFDDEGYLEGGENADEALKSITILNTPFDWTEYGRKNWWSDNMEKNDTQQISPEEYFARMIENGENNQVEFKPCLLYHFQKKSYSMAVRYIIAKVICSFLNSNGGYLFIGVSDNKEVHGLSHDFSLVRPIDKDPRDYFLLEVDKIIREYFKDVADKIVGKFVNIKNMEVFVFTVYPNDSFPVFLQGQNGKEFYVRLCASSEQYIDIEQIAMYCLGRWNKSIGIYA